MNALLIGNDPLPLLSYVPNDNFLLIDDGPVIDAVLASKRTLRSIDLKKDTFNPLSGMTYAKAREFITVLNAVFPEGESTLTRRNSNFILLEALLSAPKYLDGLIAPSKENADAYQKVQTLLLSPVLKRVLNRPTNMSFKGTIVARLDRAELGDFDAFVLGNLLISQYPGTVVIPDFGFYAHAAHSSLIRQGRLVAGIHSFDEVPKLKNQLIQIGTKVPSGCTPEDAKVLAIYAGISTGTNRYNEYIERAIART